MMLKAKVIITHSFNLYEIELKLRVLIQRNLNVHPTRILPVVDFLFQMVLSMVLKEHCHGRSNVCSVVLCVHVEILKCNRFYVVINLGPFTVGVVIEWLYNEPQKMLLIPSRHNSSLLLIPQSFGLYYDKIRNIQSGIQNSETTVKIWDFLTMEINRRFQDVQLF